MFRSAVRTGRAAPLVLALLLAGGGPLGAAPAAPASVERVVVAIGASIDAQKWTQAARNIEDLDRTIRNEVQVNHAPVSIPTDPVRARREAMEQRLADLRGEYAIFNEQYAQYLKAAKAGRIQARTDLVGDLVRKLSQLRGGPLAPLEFGRSRSSATVAADLEHLKTLSDVGRYIRVRRDSLIPAVRDAQSQRTKLVGLQAQWNVVMRSWAGRISVAGSVVTSVVVTTAPPATTARATVPAARPGGTYRNTFVFRIPEDRRAYVGAFQQGKNPIYQTGELLIDGRVVGTWDITSASEATAERRVVVDVAPDTAVKVTVTVPKAGPGYTMSQSVTTLSHDHTWDVWWFNDSLNVVMSG